MPPRILIPLIIACALFMENLDSTVLSTSLPAIARDLGEDPITLKLAVTSYLLSLAIFIPASGWVADRFGARLVFRLAIVIFVSGSIGCGLASGIEGLVIGRIVQGAGGAMMVPVGRLVILRSVAKAELVGSLAWLTIPALIGPIFGPLIGGFLTTYLSWRYIFWINVPIGLIGIGLATKFLPHISAPEPGRFDSRGFVLSGLGLSLTMFGASSLGLGYWPLPVNLVMLGTGIAFVVWYCFYARTAERPLVDLNLLRIPTFRAAIVGGSLFRVGVGATPFLLPLMLQFGFGLSAFQSGMLTFASGVGSVVMKFAAQPILRAFGFRTILTINAVISACFVAAPASFSAATPWFIITMVLLAGGFFRSLEFTSINALGYADIDQERMSRATSFSSVAQQLSISWGVSMGAFTLEALRAAHGTHALQPTDFSIAFIAVGLVSLCSVLMFWRLSHDAGAEVSGRVRAQPDQIALARQRGI